MEFTITVVHYRRNILLVVRRIYIDASTERYEVLARNGRLVVQNNWPIFRNRGLKHRRPDWLLIEGNLSYYSLVEQIFTAIEQHLSSVNP